MDKAIRLDLDGKTLLINIDMITTILGDDKTSTITLQNQQKIYVNHSITELTNLIDRINKKKKAQTELLSVGF